MAKADHVYVRRTGYTHHGIDMGDGTVIHCMGAPGQKVGASFRRMIRARGGLAHADVRTVAIMEGIERAGTA
jgi:hypothetical protein